MGIFHLIILYKGLTLDGGTRFSRVPFFFFFIFIEINPQTICFIGNNVYLCR